VKIVKLPEISIEPGRVDKQEQLALSLCDVFERVHVSLGQVKGGARARFEANPIHEELESAFLDEINLILARMKMGARLCIRAKFTAATTSAVLTATTAYSLACEVHASAQPLV
jgi:hypothetical protein